MAQSGHWGGLSGPLMCHRLGDKSRELRKDGEFSFPSGFRDKRPRVMRPQMRARAPSIETQIIYEGNQFMRAEPSLRDGACDYFAYLVREKINGGGALQKLQRRGRKKKFQVDGILNWRLDYSSRDNSQLYLTECRKATFFFSQLLRFMATSETQTIANCVRNFLVRNLFRRCVFGQCLNSSGSPAIILILKPAKASVC